MHFGFYKKHVNQTFQNPQVSTAKLLKVQSVQSSTCSSKTDRQIHQKLGKVIKD